MSVDIEGSVKSYCLLLGADYPSLESSINQMQEQAARIGDRIMKTLRAKDHSQRPKVLVVGMGSDRGQSDLSHSPGKALAVHLLSEHDVYVEFADPLMERDAISFIPQFEDAMWGVEGLRTFDAILVAVDQNGYDYTVLDQLEREGKIIEWLCRR
ncbi:unnamed protein product [Zymoseptoria tritici ST99CH_3D1]|nr:unnamed protein product [Zymoseptoria tritici ST99CH_3D1]